MDELNEFLQSYAVEVAKFNHLEDADFEGCKIINRNFALKHMRAKQACINELMLIYNMAAHFSTKDPAGIYYAINMISGPKPLLHVNMTTFALLLCEMSRDMT